MSSEVRKHGILRPCIRILVYAFSILTLLTNCAFRFIARPGLQAWGLYFVFGWRVSVICSPSVFKVGFWKVFLGFFVDFHLILELFYTLVATL